MGINNVDSFYEAVENNPQIQQELEQTLAKEQENFIEKLVHLGKASGYDFDKEDVVQMTNETMALIEGSGELDDADLETVSGGAIPLLVTAGLMVTQTTLFVAPAVGAGIYLVAKTLSE